MNILQPGIIGPVAAAIIALIGVFFTIRSNKKKKAEGLGGVLKKNEQISNFSNNTTQIQAGRDVHVEKESPRSQKKDV